MMSSLRVGVSMLLCNLFVSHMCIPLFIDTDKTKISDTFNEAAAKTTVYNCIPLHECKHYYTLFGDIMSENVSEKALSFYNRISCRLDDHEKDIKGVKIYKGKINVQHFYWTYFKSSYLVL